MIGHVISLIISIVVTYLAMKVVPALSSTEIQPIASTVATIAGILFGFVMASLTVLASAKDNSLVQNTTKTKYLPKLVTALNHTMWTLLVVCLLFLSSLFIPDSITVISGNETKLISVVVGVGVFVFTWAICKFISVWNEFSAFARAM